MQQISNAVLQPHMWTAAPDGAVHAIVEFDSQQLVADVANRFIMRFQKNKKSAGAGTVI